MKPGAAGETGISMTAASVAAVSVRTPLAKPRMGRASI